MPLVGITSPVVAAYLQTLLQSLSVASAKLHLSALRHALDWLTERGVLSVNPAAAVRGPRLVVHEGKTPCSSATRRARSSRASPAMIW